MCKGEAMRLYGSVHCEDKRRVSRIHHLRHMHGTKYTQRGASPVSLIHSNE